MVQKYTFNDHGGSCMTPDPDGRWVTLKDYEALEKQKTDERVEALQREVDQLRDFCKGIARNIGKMLSA